ncbi:tetratricopeptide repeat protein [Nonomuraea rubra]|uniref:tetratricopeptide repeat protein n=1 Tax=Nonomuraea rubra TaxID=46180 RepID=UPI0033D9E041
MLVDKMLAARRLSDTVPRYFAFSWDPSVQEPGVRSDIGFFGTGRKAQWLLACLADMPGHHGGPSSEAAPATQYGMGKSFLPDALWACAVNFTVADRAALSLNVVAASLSTSPIQANHSFITRMLRVMRRSPFWPEQVPADSCDGDDFVTFRFKNVDEKELWPPAGHSGSERRCLCAPEFKHDEAPESRYRILLFGLCSDVDEASGPSMSREDATAILPTHCDDGEASQEAAGSFTDRTADANVARKLAMLLRDGRTDEAVILLYSGGDEAAHQLAALLIRESHTEEAITLLHARADPGDRAAARKLVRLLIREEGYSEEAITFLRARAERGDGEAAELLAEPLRASDL